MMTSANYLLQVQGVRYIYIYFFKKKIYNVTRYLGTDLAVLFVDRRH
jgi:hypothetical protein